jgi:Protein of unknown function, DUF481
MNRRFRLALHPHFPAALVLMGVFVLFAPPRAQASGGSVPPKAVETAKAGTDSGPKAGKEQAKPAPDVLVFINGDQLSGKFVRAVGSDVTFHSDIVGDVTVKWNKVKELHTASKLVVLASSVSVRHRKLPSNLPEGTLTLAKDAITVHPATGASVTVPVKKAQFVLDDATLRRELRGNPSWREGWHGALTAGATIVQATQEEYTVTGGISLARTVPTVSWLDSRNRTILDFSGSYGKITQPGYTAPSGTPPVPVYTPASVTKSTIYHADAERDEYFSPRFYLLAQTVFDHNYSQNLDLQQTFGGGLGWTAIKRPHEELDFKSTIQYEGQSFIQATAGENQELVGSTLATDYALKLKHNVVFKQNLTYEPAYNNPYAYSGSETDSLTVPFFKNLSFSMGTTDSYLNDPPLAVPPTKPNSFQLTTGLSYTLKSKY